MKLTLNDFSLTHTFECGQCFRWEKQEDGSYIGVAGGRAARLRKEGALLSIDSGTDEDFDSFWRTYLDADRDYSEIKKALSVNDVMRQAVSFGSGIRILRQDFFEALISFIISQRSSIPKIKSCVEKLCRLCGDEIFFEDKTYYSFPSAKNVAMLSDNELKSLGVGYRAPYISNAARAVLDGQIDARALFDADTIDARRALLSLYGVGDKVCDCVLLFSIGKYDLFPSDVWIKRVMEEEFSSSSAKECGEKIFGQYSGFAQQYLFYWRKYHVV